uniref:Domain of unknown function DB domain-containing protein n=1 Tax=Romanomermis culicivorax TaxID=13658 RepID=A0A915IF32_ROMCU
MNAVRLLIVLAAWLVAAVGGLCMTDSCLHTRIQKCCHDMGQRIGKRTECLRFCGFNVTSDLLFEEGGDCLDQLQVLMYCSSEGGDHTQCCKNKGVDNKCMPFCRGDVSGLCPDDVAGDYPECITAIGDIMACHKQALSSDSVQWTVKSKSPRMKKCPK